MIGALALMGTKAIVEGEELASQDSNDSGNGDPTTDANTNQVQNRKDQLMSLDTLQLDHDQILELDVNLDNG
jgi:hypothetical protein